MCVEDLEPARYTVSLHTGPRFAYMYCQTRSRLLDQMHAKIQLVAWQHLGAQLLGDVVVAHKIDRLLHSLQLLRF